MAEKEKRRIAHQKISLIKRRRKNSVIGVTLGDLDGIGPEVFLKANVEFFRNPTFIPVVFGRKDFLQTLNRRLNLPTMEITTLDKAVLGQMAIVEIDSENYEMQSLKQAVHYLEEMKIDALVTGPVSKKRLVEGKKVYRGHTDFFSSRYGDDLVMMFVSPQVRLSLVTTHIPLKDVLREVTSEKVHNTVLKTHKALQDYFGIEQPRIGVCGLNPHAGEAGLLGSEEREWLISTIDFLRKEGISLTGPLSPDTAFVHPERFDAVISLYHDQGLAPFKALTFHQSCQMTLGLPFIRTSVDHGTAKDIVGKNCADCGSFYYALEVAVDLAQRGVR